MHYDSAIMTALFSIVLLMSPNSYNVALALSIGLHYYLRTIISDLEIKLRVSTSLTNCLPK